MMPALILELPFPPSVNHYWRHVLVNRRPQVHISAEGKAYRKSVWEAVIQHAHRKAAPGRLDVRVTAFMPDRRTRDLDNLFKSLLDSLTYARVIDDDGLIDKLSIERGPIVKGGRVQVSISEVTV